MPLNISLEKRVENIEKRNDRVENDKAWETSFTRRIILIFLTYVSLATYFKFILQTNPWLNAIVPTTGFWLSTLSLPFFKRVWKKYFYKK